MTSRFPALPKEEWFLRSAYTTNKYKQCRKQEHSVLIYEKNSDLRPKFFRDAPFTYGKNVLQRQITISSGLMTSAGNKYCKKELSSLTFRNWETKFLEKKEIIPNFCRKSHHISKNNGPHWYIVPYLQRWLGPVPACWYWIDFWIDVKTNRNFWRQI